MLHCVQEGVPGGAGGQVLGQTKTKVRKTIYYLKVFLSEVKKITEILFYFMVRRTCKAR